MDDEHGNNCKLTEHMVLTKTRANSLSDITQINIWGFNLKDVSLFTKIENVEIIALPLNNISTLQSFSKCKKLKQLLLRKNQISDFNQLDYLMNLPNLTILSLSENPISEDCNYRSKVIKKLPQLKVLDSIEITDKDFVLQKTTSTNIPCNEINYFGENDTPNNTQNKRIQNEIEESQYYHKKHRKHRSNNTKEQNYFAEYHDVQQLNETYPQRNNNSLNNNQKPRMNKTQRYNEHMDSSSSQIKGNYGNNSILIAILSLLPELTNDDLTVVLNSVQQRLFLNQSE